MSERLYTLGESFMLGHQTCRPLSPGAPRSLMTFYGLEKMDRIPSQRALEKHVLAQGGTWECDQGFLDKRLSVKRHTFEDGGPELLVFVEREKDAALALAFLKAAQTKWGGTITCEHQEVIG